MSFVVSEPLAAFFVMTVLGLALRPLARRVGNAIIIFAACALYCLSTPLVSSHLLNALQEAETRAADGSRMKPQAIVVLGGDLRRDATDYGMDTVGELSLERIRFAAKLHRETALPILVTGAGSPSKPVAVAMAETLSGEFGVEVRWVEPTARNTFENARHSATLLRGSGVSVVYLVTHAWHMPRSVEAFERMGFTVIAAPTAFAPVSSGTLLTDYIPFSKSLINSSYAFHEIMGRIWYHLAHYE